MGTDAKAVIELWCPKPMYKKPYAWATVDLQRDYVLFDLIGVGRSDDPSLALIRPRNIINEGCDEPDPASTWLRPSELEQVAVAYRESTGADSLEALALARAARTLEGDAGDSVRVVFRFY